MSSLPDYCREITQNRQNGASQLYDQFLSKFAEYVNENKGRIPSLMSNLPQEIVAVRPDMAPFYHAAKAVNAEITRWKEERAADLATIFPKLLSSLMTERAEAVGRVVAFARSLLPAKGVIMLHSRTSTVRDVMTQALDRGTQVFISESRPGEEGRLFAEELHSRGFRVTLFPDDAKLALLPRADFVLLGTDWLSEHDFTNKIGSHSLAVGAGEFGIPIYVVTDHTKMVPSHLRQPRQSTSQEMSNGVSWEAPLFEETLSDLVTSFITDLGLLKPLDVRLQIETTWRDTQIESE